MVYPLVSVEIVSKSVAGPARSLKVVGCNIWSVSHRSFLARSTNLVCGAIGNGVCFTYFCRLWVGIDGDLCSCQLYQSHNQDEEPEGLIGRHSDMWKKTRGEVERQQSSEEREGCQASFHISIRDWTRLTG